MAEPLTRNPAHLLADLLESLSVPSGTQPQSVHGFRDEADVDAWRQHVDRLELARTVDERVRMLAAKQDSSVFERSVPYWYAGIGMAATPWDSARNTQAPRRACPLEHLNMLRALALLLDHQPQVSIDEAARRSLLDVIEEARNILGEDDAMDPVIRDYLTRLLARISLVLDNVEKYGAEPLRSAAFELAGAMYSQALREPDQPKRGRWAALGWAVAGVFFTKTAEAGADDFNALIEHSVKAIGGS